MIMRLLISAIFFLLYSTEGASQKEDHIWLIGYEPFDVIIPERAADTTRGATTFDFNTDPVRIYYDPKRLWDMDGGNSSICDKDGNLVAYSNGMVIINEHHKTIEDTINYGDDVVNPRCIEWEYNNFGNDTFAIPAGLLGTQRVMILPVGKTYFTFYNTYDYCKEFVYKLSYSSFQVDQTNTDGKMLEKDVLVLMDTLITSVYAVRHGNGRDWWLITFTKGHKEIIIYLINPFGVTLHSKQPTLIGERPESVGQICVSPDGKFLAWYIGYMFKNLGGGFVVAAFDRCTGIISNPVEKKLPQPTLGHGISFSVDGKFLYVCNSEQIRQYDMISNNILSSEKIVAQYDGFKHYFAFDTVQPNPIGYDVDFCQMKLGPDGRIYIFPSTANRWISVMEFPTEQGVDCRVRQHSLLMNTNFTRTVPNMPEFRLGPLDGSACDTLGIDNDPIAKYRYEPDTIDHLKIRYTDLSYFRPEMWSWDFGDDSPKVNIRHPYHTYAKNGTYQVCLTVGNENSSNTFCRTITIGTSKSDDETLSSKADVTLFPNPVEDYLLVTLGEYIPQHGQMIIYDISGRPIHTQRIYYGQNNVDMSGFEAGMYVWKMLDGKVEIKTGKVVKISGK